MPNKHLFTYWHFGRTERFSHHIHVTTLKALVQVNFHAVLLQQLVSDNESDKLRRISDNE